MHKSVKKRSLILIIYYVFIDTLKSCTASAHLSKSRMMAFGPWIYELSSHTRIMSTEVAETTTKAAIATATATATAAPTEEVSKLTLNEPKASFQDQFKAFSKFGDTKSDGKLITLSQSDKWMKQAKVIDKKITTTDTGIHFKKFKALKISYSDYNKFLDDLAKTKKVELQEIKDKMASCGAPGVVQVSAGKAAQAVERLTDTSKYTGSHKERFDATGKGKGIAGRKNLVDASGYVSGYQHKDTYDNTH